MKEDRGSWYLLTAIILGIVLGLVYSWVISPAEFIDTPPSSLRSDYKDKYRVAIAAAYEATGNLQRAEARLNLLNDDDPSLALVVQAQQYLADEDDFADAQALANLASAFGQVPTPLPTRPENTPTEIPTNTSEPTETASPEPTLTSTLPPTGTPTTPITPTLIITPTLTGTPGPSPTPTITRTPRPTSPPTQTPSLTPTVTPTPTLMPPLILDSQINVCNPILGEPQLQIFVSNAAGVGIPGVEVIVSWDDGEDHFFTGLKPDIDIGYADFVMTPEVLYSVKAGDGGQLIPGLIAPPCTYENNINYWGSIRLIFAHP